MELLVTPMGILFSLIIIIFFIITWWLYAVYQDNKSRRNISNYLTPKMEKKFHDQFLKKIGHKVT